MKRLLSVCLIALLLCGCSTTYIRNPERIVIALLDTGVSTVAIESTHLLEGFNYVTNTTETEDLINHGTAVASTILGCDSADVMGMAPEAFIVPLVIVSKLDGKVTSATPEQLAKAIRESVDVYHADIINISLGIQKDNDALRKAVAYVCRKGVPVISAVGNDGEDGEPYYPAAYDAVLAVGSCDRDGNRSDFTQPGAEVLAPGEGILLASRNGRKYGIKGTSFATGFVSGYAAKLFMVNPDLTPEELFDRLVEKSKDGFLPPDSQ